jgi:GTPase SAR1 family protein
MFGRNRKRTVTPYDDITEGLKGIYKQRLLPLEKEYNFHDFHTPMLEDPDFEAKPLVMVMGQYSTGKTTFIRYILEKDFPGMRIGPEPTTDTFHVVDYAEEDGHIPGNVLAVDTKKPYTHLQDYGGTFLSRFQCSTTKSPVLKSVTLLDTPGILAGEKQTMNRGYDFTGVLKWFAEKADRIILVFDAHKLDISDEFKHAIEAIRAQDDKIRIILNKADMMNHQQLMRVYGALLWSLSKILGNPEVSRVYVGSFWSQPLRYVANRELFEAEQGDLFSDLQGLPRFSTMRKMNDLIKRARSAKVHAILVSYLKKQMPTFGKEGKKKELLKGLDKVFEYLSIEFRIPLTDFPDVNETRRRLANYDFTKFNQLDKKMIDEASKMIGEEIPNLMKLMPAEDKDKESDGRTMITGGIFDDSIMPGGVGVDEGSDEFGWVVAKDKPKYDEIFNTLEQEKGKVTGRAAKEEMMKSHLPNKVLGKVWKLADTDNDGMLDSEEFALAMHLIKIKVEGHDIPDVLPRHLLPPSKRPGGGGGTVFD